MNKFTDKYIDLASHPDIQKMLTPEVGMWCVPDNQNGRVYLIVRPDSTPHHDFWVLNNCCSTYVRERLILLPFLEWLMEKLRDSKHQLYFNGEMWVYRISEFEFELANTAPLACLLALRRVMGIEKEV